MEMFHDMKKYHDGRTPDGIDHFKLPMQADDENMIGRECPNTECQPKYFKMSLTLPEKISEKIENFSQIDVTCPYCGTIDNIQLFHTENQIAWIESMIFRDVAITFDDIIKSSLESISPTSKGMFSISIKYKPGNLPSVRHYVEEKLKRNVVCDDCGYNYAVYGISFLCPLCGKGNLLQHLNRSADTIKVLLEEHERISRERGPEVGRQMVGNALEDVVGLFEGFLKHIYQYEIKRRLPTEEAVNKIAKIRVNFQRIEGAEGLFSQDLSFALFGECPEEDRAFLQEKFLRRHVLTHNLGLIDAKYIEKAEVYEKQGAELEIIPTDVLKALKIVVRVVTSATQCLGKHLKN
ncbi:MAG: hypothetical protein WCE90_04545 [Candidatus Zixiibacteriota bacterium]